MPSPVRFFRPTTLLGLALASALAAGACTSQDAGTAADTDAPTVVLDFQPVAALSPFSDDAASLTRLAIAETLVSTDRDGIPQPRLATSWEQDDNSVTFTLREGVHFHDGTDLDAQAVVTALDHAINAPARPKGLGEADLKVEATAAGEVKVTSSEDDPILVQRFSDPGTVILSSDAYSTGEPNPIHHGTGAYRLDSLDGKHAELSAFDRYWGTTAQVDHLHAQFISDPTARANSMRAGESTVIRGVAIANIGEVEASGAKLTHVSLPRTTSLHFNTKRGVFARPEVRKAAAAAIDPAVVVDHVYEGYAGNPKGSLFGRDFDWAKDTPQPTFHKGGTTAGRIILATYNDRAELPEAAQVVAEQLRTAGFDVEIKVGDYASMESSLLEGEYDLVIGSRNFMLGAADPASTLRSDFTCEGGNNLSQFCNEAFDAEVAKILSIQDTKERNKRTALAGVELVREAVVLPLVTDQAHNATKGYQGIDNDPRELAFITPEFRAE